MADLKEKCGIFGVFGAKLEAAKLTYLGLWSLQHRGQEASGIASSDGKTIHIHKDLGLVAHVYSQTDIEKLKGHIAIGHNRYSTSKGSLAKHNQPILEDDNIVAVAHNGNLPSTKLLEEFLISKKQNITDLNDTGLMAAAIHYYLQEGATLEEALIESYPLFTGAFSLVVMTKDKVAALRDPCGLRPLSFGRLGEGYIFASETCALDIVNAAFVRDVYPGEMIVIDNNGAKFYPIVKGTQKLDIFEFVYFARPDSMLLGKRVDTVRYNMGKELAKEYEIDADIVVPVPDSAIPAAEGYAKYSGIPFRNALIKNRYIHRTFINPEQNMREQSVKMKFNPIPETLRGQRVIVIDDSLVRGTTTKKLIEILYLAGAKEVHLLICSPPVKYPDFYGIDTPDQNKLIAAHRTIDQIKDYIGAHSLSFLSLEGLIDATELPAELFSTSCFTGVYPISIGERAAEIIYPEKKFPKKQTPEIHPIKSPINVG
jgi:amidophosphoribosyltransferase